MGNCKERPRIEIHPLGHTCYSILEESIEEDGLTTKIVDGQIFLSGSERYNPQINNYNN